MYKKIVKRLIDIFLSILFLIVLSPLLLILFFLVKFKLGSPVIFKQKRPGKGGKIFVMYKFRTMTSDCDCEGKLLPDEDRLTKFGKKLRKSSLDELPELFNIIKGDMSFIGPRPLLVKDYVFFSEETKKRQSVIPGLSGLAQINGRNNLDWEEKFKFDLYYEENVSFSLDFKIFFKTITKAFIKKTDVERTGFATDLDYGDYLLLNSKISKEFYDLKIKESDDLIKKSYDNKK